MRIEWCNDDRKSFVVMAEEYCDFKYKVCVIGAAGSGKTALVEQLINKKFSEATKTTVGVDFCPYRIDYKEHILRLEIWDTAGQEQYKAVAKTYFRNALGCVLCFDTTDVQSFNDLPFWLGQFRELANSNAVILLVGTKADLEDQRQISLETAEQFAKDNLLVYTETSALTGKNVKETFEKLAHQLFDMSKEGKIGNVTKNNQTESADSVDLAEEMKGIPGANCLAAKC